MQNDDDEVKLNVHAPKIHLGLLHVLLIVMSVDKEVMTVIRTQTKVRGNH